MFLVLFLTSHSAKTYSQYSLIQCQTNVCLPFVVNSHVLSTATTTNVLIVSIMYVELYWEKAEAPCLRMG